MKFLTLILAAVMTLAFSFTATPADARLTEGQKCAMKANLLSGKFSLCLNKADANVSKGKVADTAAADAKCEDKFRGNWVKVRDKAQDKDATLGEYCDGKMTIEIENSVEASALIAAGRDLTAFTVNDNDLANDSGIQTLVQTHVADAVAAVDITSDNAAVEQAGCEAGGGTWGSGTCTPADITSDNAAVEQAGCEAGGGTWGSDTCTPAPVAARNCFIEGACGADGFNYGAYAGGTIESSGCNGAFNSAYVTIYNEGRRFPTLFLDSEVPAISAEVCG
jgi:hypothetical protein